MRRNYFYILGIFICFFVCTKQTAFAQFEEGKETVISSHLIGASIAKDSADTLIYTHNTDSTRIKNIVSLKINEQATLNNAVGAAPRFFTSGFTAAISLKIDYWDSVGGTLHTIYKTLTVNYDSSTGAKYNVLAYVVLPDKAEKVIITIADNPDITGESGWSASDVLKVLRIENEMRIIRYPTLSTSIVPVFDHYDYLPGSIRPDEVNVVWTVDPDANNNMTQLEWSYVETEMEDFYKDAGIINWSRVFDNNSTRVDLDYGQNNYKIPLLYGDTGRIYFRVRTALRKNDGNVVTGSWSAIGDTTFGGHEPDINWQSSISFAESGKRKTVIKYFDGTMRVRQTVTKDNTTGNTVVAETIYDLQGRPNIQILPTPTIDSSIQYFRDFNRFVGQTTNNDPAKYFDLTPAGVQCTSSPALDTSYGNGKYYSANNPWLGIEPKSSFIPNAGGFDYTETRYMDDATERVRSQGGVGVTHQIGSNHETKYYYGKPNQSELDALFGTEVGDASHYNKNMVRDANGQISVSYVDMHDRTIATALAGTAPAGMTDIYSNTSDYPSASGLLTNQLLTAETNIISSNSIESISTILTPISTIYHFTYKLDPGILNQFSCTNQHICFDCKYDLEISIKSEECGDTTPKIRRYNNLQIQLADSACNRSMFFKGTGADSVLRQITFTDTLGIGSWVVRKTLTINDSMFQVRRDSALKVFLCHTQQSIYDSVVNILYTTSGCGLPTGDTTLCDSCMNHLGTFSFYRASYLLSIGSNPDTSNHLYDAQIHVQYTQDSLACTQACSLSPQLATLYGLRNRMLNDMIPYTGQYAVDSVRNPVTGVVTAMDSSRLESKYNIFTTAKVYSGYTKPFYQHPLNENGQAFYYTEDNQIDSIIQPAGNNHTILDTISRNVYTSLFERSWTTSLIKYHPEYSKLHYAETTLKTSYEWADKVQACQTYAQAHSLGYDNPLSSDPYVLNHYVPADTVKLRQYLLSYVGTTSGNPSIWQLANGMVLCATIPDLHKDTCVNTKSKTGLDAAANTTSLKDQVWEKFIGLYLSYRNEMLVSHINTHEASVLSQANMDTLQKENKQLIFATAQDIADQNHWTWWDTLANHNPPVPPNDSTFNTINPDRCLAQKPFWRSRLLQCEALIALIDSNHTASVDSIINIILDSMVMVCHHSIDAQNPWGASNVNPSYIGLPQNFENIVNHVFTAHGISTPPTNYFCNPYSIDFPKPYGHNPAVIINYSNKIDSCGCARFAQLKTEAHASSYDTLSFSSMNSFLKEEYHDSLTLVLWNGLQHCGVSDSCWYTWGVADDYFGLSGMRSSHHSGKQSITVHPESLTDCTPPVITSATWGSFGGGTVRIVYSTIVGASNCHIRVLNSSNVVINDQLISHGTDSVFFDLTSCLTYKFVIVAVAKGCPDSLRSDTTTLYPGAGCSCPHPTIDSIKIILPNPTLYSENVKIKYTLPGGSSNCSVLVFLGSSTTLFSTYSINCGSSDTTIELDACYKYRFLVKCDVGDSCIGVHSDTIRLDSCWHQSCVSVFAAVYLPGFVVIPQFLNCGYVKPCITCNILDSLTGVFQTIYPDYISVPYLDSTTTTEDQARQNSLWARFLNYKTGFSKNAIDYIAAIQLCSFSHPNTIALCSFIKPLNDPGDLYPHDTLPCRTVQNEALFISQLIYQKLKDSVTAVFDSLYKAKCFAARTNEQFYAKYAPNEYHYTLYYYDQAGNLVKTIPPVGVRPDYDSTYLANVRSYRSSASDLTPPNNNDSISTKYCYNSLNQVVAQKTPDAGLSKFWYDRLGRLAVSQNAKQATASKYSYTLYDVLGRITEVGQATNSTTMTQTISQDTSALSAWIADVGTDTKKEITLTVYDIPYTPIAVSVANLSGLYQKNLRNRVSYSMVFDDETQKTPLDDGTVAGGNSATYYSYDIHGNVDTLLQDYRSGMGQIACSGDTANRFKKMVYSYDLISGKVNDVAYQPGAADQYYHHYNYDAENRLTEVRTSRDKIYWEREATYDYYRHGPLARTVLGNNQVQGLDYAYSIQGWLKAVNSTNVNPDFDMGADGKAGSLNSLVSRDAYGFDLNYFLNDYAAINTTVHPLVKLSTFPFAGDTTVGAALYNGNISAMITNVPVLGTGLLYGYRYDQLNRLSRMTAFDSLNYSTNTFGSGPHKITDYREQVTYDPNGNIRTYNREGHGAHMDSLTYNYNFDGGGHITNNRLRHLNDAVGASTVGDIGNEPTDNYGYDQIGNLTRDSAEHITSIEWTVYGKIKTITKNATGGAATISYTYDASGNRISKKVDNGTTIKSTYYVRDASGNVMSIYSSGEASINSGDLTQSEIDLYGSSRLGVYNVNVDVQCTPTDTGLVIFTRGNKFFELTNHLGNVLATISDKNIQKSTGGDTVKYYIADVVTANDYYPFGMLQPGRKYAQNSSSYRYSINSQEKESDLNDNITTAQFWEYDSRLARRWNVDPIYQISPYGCFSNNPLRFSDQLGKDTGDVVVLFAGANLGGAITKAFGGGKGSTPDIKKELLKSLTQNGTSVATFTSGYWGVDLKTEKGFDEATQAAYEYIKKNHIEGGRVAIYGYSWGANFVSYLAGRLAKDGISVELGITIDAAGGFSNGDVNRTIDKNVAVNLNYYQTNYSKITGSHGGPNKAQDPQKTRIFNYDLTGTPYRSNDCSVCEESDEYTPVSHSNIHLATKEYVIRKIVELLDVDNGIRLPSPPPFKMEPNKPISTRVDKIYPQLPIKFN